MARKLPITIVTGFLGAGKTTLLASLLRKSLDSNFAVIVNEFGAVSIDGMTLKREQRAGLEIHELSNGLLAYSDDERLACALDAVSAHHCQFDYVLIETSGLAVPTALLATLERADLKTRFSLDAVIAIVDTPVMLSGLFDNNDVEGSSGQASAMLNSSNQVFAQQLRAADVVVLNKLDNIEEEQLLVAESRVRSLAPDLRFVELAYEKTLDAKIALGLRLNQPAATAPALASVGAAVEHRHSIANGHAHSGLEPHEHGLLTHSHLHEHDPAWLSFALHSHKQQESEKLQTALEEISRSEPVLRLKGFINRRSAFEQAVQGVRLRVEVSDVTTDQVAAQRGDDAHEHHHNHEHHEHPHDHVPLREHAEPLSEIVFIGYNLDRKRVAERLSQLTATNWR